FFFQAEDGIRDKLVTGVQTCALPIYVKVVAQGPGTTKTETALLRHEGDPSGDKGPAPRAPVPPVRGPRSRDRRLWLDVDIERVEIGRASCRERWARSGLPMHLEEK